MMEVAVRFVETVAMHVIPALDQVLRAVPLERIGPPRCSIQQRMDKQACTMMIEIDVKPRAARLSD